jgi:hypothetical protein
MGVTDQTICSSWQAKGQTSKMIAIMRKSTKHGSQHHDVIHAQTARNKWCQSGRSSDMRLEADANIGILLVRPLWHPACFSPGGKQRALRRMYGKDNQILYSAKFSQGFKVVAARRAWQVAGVSNGDTKIRVTGQETHVVAGISRHENRWVVRLTCH